MTLANVSTLPAAVFPRDKLGKDSTAAAHRLAPAGASLEIQDPKLVPHAAVRSPDDLAIDLSKCVVIASVLPGSPSDAVGLQVGDILVTVDGVQLESIVALLTGSAPPQTQPGLDGTDKLDSLLRMLKPPSAAAGTAAAAASTARSASSSTTSARPTGGCATTRRRTRA